MTTIPRNIITLSAIAQGVPLQSPKSEILGALIGILSLNDKSFLYNFKKTQPILTKFLQRVVTEL